MYCLRNLGIESEKLGIHEYRNQQGHQQHAKHCCEDEKGCVDDDNRTDCVLCFFAALSDTPYCARSLLPILLIPMTHMEIHVPRVSEIVGCGRGVRE